MTWDLDLTRRLVEAKFGQAQLELARPCLKSVCDRQDYARYHYQEVNRLVDQFAEKYLNDKPLLWVLGANTNEQWAFEELMTQLGAHTIACIQSIHSIPDILAHAFYFSLRLNQVTVLDESKINANSVRKLLEQDPKFQDLVRALKQLTTEGQYKHLRALCNHSKHRSIIQPLLNEDWTGTRANRHEVRFSSFQY